MSFKHLIRLRKTLKTELLSILGLLLNKIYILSIIIW